MVKFLQIMKWMITDATSQSGELIFGRTQQGMDSSLILFALVFKIDRTFESFIKSRPQNMSWEFPLIHVYENYVEQAPKL